MVASILAAFSLEAWWEELQEQAALAEDLASVAEEMAQNRERIEFALDLMGRSVAASDLLVAAIDEAPGEATVTVADTIAFWVQQGGTLDASLGAIDALLASGRLGQVDNPALRILLAGMRDRVADAVEEQVRAMTIYDEQFVAGYSEVAIHPLVVEMGREFWSLTRVSGRELESRGDVLHPGGGATRLFASQRAALFLIAVTEMELLSMEMAEIVEMIGDLNQ